MVVLAPELRLRRGKKNVDKQQKRGCVGIGKREHPGLNRERIFLITVFQPKVFFLEFKT